jgi:hypothetical protein
MQFTVVALAALVATASASAFEKRNNETVYYTTEVHTAYTTVCPAATQLTFNGVTYTVSESTTLTITNCPCTVVKPVTTSSVVYCNTCVPSSAPVYANTTAPAVATTAAATPTKGSVGTTSAKASASATPSTITASGANKAMAFSGFSLAGLLAIAAYVL